MKPERPRGPTPPSPRSQAQRPAQEDPSAQRLHLHGRLSLQERLMLLVVIAILPLAALSIWFAVGEMRAATRLAQSQLKFAASLVAAHQDRIVESGQHLLGTISAMPLVRSPDREICESFFGQLRGRYPIYANIGLFDVHGKAVCHANGSIGDFSVAERPYFAQALAGHSFVVGEATVGKSSGRLIIPFAQPVLEGSRVTGVVFASLDLGYAATALAATELPAGAHVSVADRRGAMLMEHPLRPGGSDQAVLFQPPALLAAAREMTRGTGEWEDPSGEQRIYAFAPTRSNAGGGFLATVSLDRAQVTGAALANLGWELLAFALALVASGLAAWWLGGRVILRPAQQIVNTVQQLERGRLEARVPLQGGSPRGEFARIASAFNLMAESLQLRQIDVDNELARSRGAYSVLDLVLNSMQDAVVAVTRAGKFLMFNEAAARLFPLDGPEPLQQQWAERLGFFHADGTTPYRNDELPLVRSALGESGRQQQLVVRNPQVPGGRLLQCSWQPIHDQGGIKGGLVVFTDVTERKRAEADLVLLRKAVSRLNDIVLITEADPIDPPGPRIVFVNEAFERLTGYTAHEAIGNTPRMLQGPRTDPAALARIRAALEQGRAVREEVINYAKDGRQFWLEIDIVALAGEKGGYSHLISVQRDITARKEAERALLESERELQGYTQMLQRAAGAAPAVLAHASLEGAMDEIALQARKVIGVHCAMVTLTQCDDQGQWLHALSMSEKYAPDDWTFSRGAIDDSDLAALAVDSGRALLLTPDELEEHPRWRGFGGKSELRPRLRGLLAVPLVGREGEVIGSLQLSDKESGDFTERDQYVALELAQLAAVAIENGRLFQQIRELNLGLEARITQRTAELERQGQQYRALAEQAPQVVWHTDGEGRATFLNRAWYELVGGNEGEGLGHGWVERLHPDDLEEMRRNWRRSQETLQPFVGTRRLLARDGAYHTMSYKAAPVLDEKGQPVFWVGIDADITELKATESALRGYNRDLEAFSYSISHDLRTPLGAIGGFARALALQLEDHPDPRIGHYLDRIQAGVVKMDECISALLSLANVARSPLHYEIVDLGVIARETLEGLQMQHPERKVRVQVQGNLVAQGDLRLLRLVMENLLGNAWKFTVRNDAARIEVGRLEDGSAFYVRDNGVGFDMAYAAKLFGVFQRLHTQAEFPGTGIGLATVSRIMSRHEGRVWAESPPGGGATFFFTLD